MSVVCPQHVAKRPTGEFGVLMGLREPARHHSRAEFRDSGVPHVIAREQPQEVRLARPIRAEHGHPLAVEDLHVERRHQVSQFQPFARDCPQPGASAAQPHRDLLPRRGGRRWAGVFEFREPRLHRVVLTSHVG